MDIINKAGETITNKGKYVARKAKELAEIASLHTQINIQENSVNRIFQELGKMYYEQNRAGVNADIVEKCDEIDAAVTEIERLKKTVMTLKGIRKCTSCGAQTTDHDAVYCAICGEKLPEKEAEKEAEKESNSESETEATVENETTEAEGFKEETTQDINE
ncbi:MAG: hypothetical protein LBM69_00405 [Lachnospiraceae bacterium]|nr:hypothetical protein [Lachnospiraceae bacterium]